LAEEIDESKENIEEEDIDMTDEKH